MGKQLNKISKEKLIPFHFRGSWIRADLIALVEAEQAKTLPRLNWRQMIERIISERYSKQKRSKCHV